jgi:tetratricopeptide (TPR) repeat protein
MSLQWPHRHGAKDKQREVASSHESLRRLQSRGTKLLHPAAFDEVTGFEASARFGLVALAKTPCGNGRRRPAHARFDKTVGRRLARRAAKSHFDRWFREGDFVAGPQSSSLVKALQEAAMALRTNHFARAEQLAEKILKSNRTDRHAVLILAHALLGQNRTAEAIAPLERMARRGSDGEVETLLGAALCNSARRADGIAQLRETAARRPAYLPAFQELAGQLAKAGQFDEAIGVIEEALALAPDSTELKLDLGRLLIQNNAPARASEILASVREAAPGRPDILTDLGRALRLKGDYAAAADAYRHALALRPDDALSRVNLAACLLETGNRDGAEAALRAIVRGRPDMLGRATYTLTAASHGRCFFYLNAAAKFLGAEGT